MQHKTSALQEKAQITSAEWLSPGWVYAVRKDGGFQITDARSVDPLNRAQRIVLTVDKIVKNPDCTAIFLQKEDCAIVSEFFPDVLQRQHEPPILGKAFTL